jgi:hypothetical protein
MSTSEVIGHAGSTNMLNGCGRWKSWPVLIYSPGIRLEPLEEISKPQS